MNTLLVLILSIALGTTPKAALKSQRVTFAELPPECVAEYLPERKQERQATETQICRVDLDGDGTQELLVWTGNGGSGGEEWSVMQRKNGKYRRAGSVLGILHFIEKAPYRGLLVETPSGADCANWEYLELKNGVLISRLKLEINYAAPLHDTLRTIPIAIKIEWAP